VDLGRADVKIAIIGSRRRIDRAAVEAAVAALPQGTVVISGGASGPDTWAAEAASRLGLEVVVYRPATDGVRGYGEAARRYHERNQRIVDACERLIAFVAADRRGGTEDTIRRANRAGKPVEIR
jgi:predicted Rossmann fold nucleotide-binding protein DprA/Smf involved in DNA uptake